MLLPTLTAVALVVISLFTPLFSSAVQHSSIGGVDAGLGFAQPAFAAALPEAVAAARESGVATLSVAHSHTCTSLGYFTEQGARACTRLMRVKRPNARSSSPA